MVSQFKHNNVRCRTQLYYIQSSNEVHTAQMYKLLTTQDVVKDFNNKHNTKNKLKHDFIYVQMNKVNHKKRIIGLLIA